MSGPTKTNEDTSLSPISTETTFESVFLAEYPKMVALAAAVTGRHDHAEEIAADALARLNHEWNRVGCFDQPGGWLRKVTINLALSRRRRLAAEVKAKFRLGHGYESISLAPPSPPDQQIWQAVAELAPRQRAVIALYYLDDYTIEEIAELLGIAAATARVHLHRARQNLRQRLDHGAHDER